MDRPASCRAPFASALGTRAVFLGGTSQAQRLGCLAADRASGGVFLATDDAADRTAIARAIERVESERDADDDDDDRRRRR